MKRITFSTFILLAMFAAQPALAGDKPASNADILIEKIKADKKLVVATNMELTESEAKGFWPVYEGYQKELEKINMRTVRLIKSYADEYNANSLTDDKAKKLVDEMIAIEKAEVDLKKSYQPKLAKVIPMKKVARYLQIENKIRILGKYELAGGIPLVE